MAADDFKAPALSYIDIERRATRFIGDILMPERVRRYLEGKLNIADILEIDFVRAYGYKIEYVADDEIDESHDAEVSIVEKTIYLRDSAMARINAGGRILFSIGHEIGHVVLHEDVIRRQKVARRNTAEKLETFRSGEWQAEAFGSAVIMPYPVVFDLIRQAISKGIDPYVYVSDRLISLYNVSFSAAYKRVCNVYRIIEKGYGLRLKNEFSKILGC